MADSIVLCSVNDRKERGGRGERGVRVVYVFWVEKFLEKGLARRPATEAVVSLSLSLSLSLSPLEVVSTPEWLGL
jgi:hypothetical protein